MANLSKIFSFANPAIVSLVGVLFATEYVFVYVSESIGIVLALVSALSVYTFLSVLNLSENLAEAIEDISLLFIYIMLASALPWFFFGQDLLVPAVYSVVLTLCFWRINSKKLSLEYLGFVKKELAANCFLGLVVGVPMGVIEYLILRPPAPTAAFSQGYFLQTALHMFLFVALGEEILFRALIQKTILKVTGVVPGIFWSAVIFAAMHTVWRSVPELFFTFVAGLVLGIVYQKTGSIAGPIFLHGTNNLVLLAVMPYIL